MENKTVIVNNSLREEYVSIYDKDDNLVVKSCNPLVIEDVRLQILEKELKGYYAVGEDGTRVPIDIHDNPSYFPFQDKLPRILAKTLAVYVK